MKKKKNSVKTTCRDYTELWREAFLKNDSGV